MKKITLLAVVLFVFSTLPFSAQDDSKTKSEKLTSQDKALLKTANNYYKEGNFIRALGIYKVLAESYPSNADINYKTGICYLYKTDEKENAIEFIVNAGKLNSKLEDYKFNLGRAYHTNYKFQDAINNFKAYISENPPVVKKNLAEHYIEYCQNGETIVPLANKMIIENIGTPVNSEHSEYVPLVSYDESILIFTYKGEKSTGGLMDGNFNPSYDGEYYEDVFVSYKAGEKWTEPQSIGENINTKGHDASIALSTDGQKLFIFKSTPADKGDIYMSQLEGEVWSVPVRLGANVNTNAWEGSVSMSAEEQTLYFASERPGGLGGRDIYMSKRQSNNEWGPATNLGPTINTKYDDDAPFIHPDGISLFFSSKGHNSLGGYDIFYSSQKSGNWSDPVNMGTPVNTTDDDLYYVLNSDGETGYYSSNRKEGYGEQDIYVISPGMSKAKPILALALGQVFLDTKPVTATIKVMDADNGGVRCSYKSNSSSGKYMVALTPGTNYKLSIEVPGQPPHYEYANVKSLDSYVQLQQNFQIYSEEYLKNNKVDSTKDNTLQQKIEAQLIKSKGQKIQDPSEAIVYEQLLKSPNDVKNDSITYNVDLGTYETSTDFNQAKLSDNVAARFDSTKNANGTTFFVKNFKTLHDAELFRKKLIANDDEFAGIAQVIMNEKGKRVGAESALIKTKNKPVLVAQVQPESLVSSTPVVKDTITTTAAITTVPANSTISSSAIKTTTTVTTTAASVTIAPTTTEQPTPCDTAKTYDFTAFAGKTLNDPIIYNQLLNVAGAMCLDGLTFRVQVGAYRHPENYKYINLKPLGYTIENTNPYGDGITRFIMGEFKTLKDTEKLRQKSIKAGTKDAWVIAIYNGKRYTLEELIPLNFFNKAVN